MKALLKEYEMGAVSSCDPMGSIVGHCESGPMGSYVYDENGERVMISPENRNKSYHSKYSIDDFISDRENSRLRFVIPENFDEENPYLDLKED